MEMTHPVIFEGTRLTIPAPLQQRLRHCAASLKRIHQYDKETWVVPGVLPLHEDHTNHGLVTYGVILLNDTNLLLAYDDTVYSAPAGMLYRIDARITHGALAYHGQSGIGPIAFLALDLPSDYSIHRFASEAIVAIAAKARGETPE